MKTVIISALAVAASLAFAIAARPAAAATFAAPSAAVRDLAPTGRLRVAINYGNTVLAQRNPETGELTGASVMIAMTIGQRLHVPVELTAFASAGKVFDAFDQGQLDMAFLAVEPERATKIDFSAPYVYIDGTYLVFRNSPYHSVAELDHDGSRIAVARGAAYDLFLSRNLKHATLVRSQTSPSAVAQFINDKLDAVAGVRQFLLDASRDKPELRVIDDRYTRIDQAIGLPRGRAAGAAFVREILEELKASGKIRKSLDVTHQDGATVAPGVGR